MEITIKGDTKEIADFMLFLHSCVKSNTDIQAICKRHFENGYMYAVKTECGKDQAGCKEDTQ